MIPGIVPRKDNLNEKAKEVNTCLQNSCGSYNFHFINNANANKDTDLNMGGLHLNYQCTHVFLGGGGVTFWRPYGYDLDYSYVTQLLKTIKKYKLYMQTV